eukprot:3285412-Pyramimonas_sp.AAC.2
MTRACHFAAAFLQMSCPGASGPITYPRYSAKPRTDMAAQLGIQVFSHSASSSLDSSVTGPPKGMSTHLVSFKRSPANARAASNALQSACVIRAHAQGRIRAPVRVPLHLVNKRIHDDGPQRA